MKIIPLSSDDDIVSICDHLAWTDDAQVVFVLPEDGGVLREGLDLVRLQRYADSRRTEVALIVADVDVARQARALGIPSFTTIGAARRGRRRWWRTRRRREIVGLPTHVDAHFETWQNLPRLDVADQEEAQRRLTPTSERKRWVWRYAAILLVLLTFALMYVAFLYLIPGATLTLHPEVIPVEVERPLVADPETEISDLRNGVLPARQLVTTQSWQSEVGTTGEIEVPEASARGKVIFANLLEQSVTVPAGSRVSTTDGSRRTFQTIEAIEIAGAVGSTAEAEIVAIEPGPDGNVEANLINQVEGSLGVQVEVRNLEPVTGGGVRLARSVTEADRERLRNQAVQFLIASALSSMETELTPHEFLTPDSLRLVNLLDETYSHEVGEQTSRLTLSMQAEVAGTAVNTTAASDLAYFALGQQIAPGYTLVPDSIRFESGDIRGVDDAGRVNFSMIARGTLARDLEIGRVVDAIAGQDPEAALAYLDAELPLSAPAAVDIWPVWFERIPYLPTRIEARVETGS